MNKNHPVFLIALWIFILFTFAFTPNIITSGTINFSFNRTTETSEFTSLFPLSGAEVDWVEETLDDMTLYEKCAQLVMPAVFENTSSINSDEIKKIKKLVKENKVGGLVLFKGTSETYRNTINSLQKLAEIPLLIAADFENGLGMRLEDGLEFPSNMALAATGDLNLAYEMGKTIALESRAIGVNQNFAPVADINNNPENPIINIRSFSEDKEIVSRFTSSFITGSVDGKILTTVKHFPGHGNTFIDSHQDIPVINLDKFNLANNELVPFMQAIKAGVHSVMVGHLDVPSLEPGHIPASLSKYIVTDLLKGEMGFHGLVVTDAMNMSAITKYYSVEEASVMAVNAGNDILLMPDDNEAAINSIYNAVNSGKIDIDRINESVRKILSAKKWLKINENNYTDFANFNINQFSHLRLAEEIAEKSITLIRDEKNIIPVKPEKIYNTAVITVTDGSGNENSKIFQNFISEKFGYTTKSLITRNSKDRDFEKAFKNAEQADLIILPTFIRIRPQDGSVALNEKHKDFIDKILELNSPAVLISFGNPYLLSLFPEAETYFCSYGGSAISQEAVLKSLLGENDISGRLPVSIPNTEFIIGSGKNIRVSTLKEAAEEEKSRYNFSRLDVLMNQAIKDKVFPGGVLLIGKEGKILYEKPFGNFTYDNKSTLISPETMFDLASLTKVVATTTAAMMLYDRKKLDLDEKVAHYLPEFSNNKKEKITVRNLLVHNSGLIAYRNYRSLYNNADEVINAIMNEKLEYPTGSKMVYSDLNMILLQKIIERISGKNLDIFLRENLFEPLQMNRTMFNPPKEYYYYCPETSNKFDPVKRNKGVVHDGNAFILNGVAGHAGLFSAAGDLAVFLQMILQNGKYGKTQLIKPETVEEWTRKQSSQSTRALGWDTKSETGSSAGRFFSKNSFGHTGFTGTSVWVDKEREMFVILLTNRVYPDENNNQIRKFRPQIHDAVIQVLDY